MIEELAKKPPPAFYWNWHVAVFVFAACLLVLHLLLWLLGTGESVIAAIKIRDWPLWIALLAGGLPLIVELGGDLAHGRFGSDLLAGISIITSLALGEVLAGTIVVMMLSGGHTLESYAVRNASSVLNALAKRMPNKAHRLLGPVVEDVDLESVVPGDRIVVYPHETCPVDGTVEAGHGSMDESYLSGEPYQVPKSSGSAVMSGSINSNQALTIHVSRRAADSRYAKVMQVMHESAQRKPAMRRLGDKLGALYTPLALSIAIIAWSFSGDATRFLAVLVVATPCPLLLAIPIAIIGTISLAARRNIIIKDPSALETLELVKTALFDKTGTLTYGQPVLSEIFKLDGWTDESLLSIVASLEQYSKHPLSSAIRRAAQERQIVLVEVEHLSERPGEGLRGEIANRRVWITSRKLLAATHPGEVQNVPARSSGLECLVVVDERFVGLLRFRDEIRQESSQFIKHLKPKHGIHKLMLVSGDREEEVRYLAERVGGMELYASQSPEDKVALVMREAKRGPTMFVGDGINDAPALAAATIGVAFGSGSEITSEAADVVILDSSLSRVDELLHIGRHMRRIALQSVVGGMALSFLAMLFAAAGLLPPVAGAVVQEVIDVAAIFNALRAAIPPKSMTDYASVSS